MKKKCCYPHCQKPKLARSLCKVHYDAWKYTAPTIRKYRKRSKIVVKGDKAFVQLTQDKWAMIDADDVDKVS